MSEQEEGLDEAGEGAKAGQETSKEEKKGGGILMAIVGLLVVTLLAGGAGGGIGIYLAGAIEDTVTARLKETPEDVNKPALRYSGDMVLQPIEPVITNLSDPSDVWIRLETAIVFANGKLPEPQVTAAEIRQDIVAYARTVPLKQLEGPSALQHLRDDLNERVQIRTNGEVSELVIVSMVVQ
ncbi:flagellar basal body-associated FliL family protein [Afifella sp. IM 167]|uniref:flagellar basal body-associated FliL family protein n=1 Tax=Afifella sp. IM 167 TaxID=2033586 RepID=UPI001CCBD2A9|nr:flagellar basal body-associated FliL family protein [Afifella sp. IM 167]MBZ8131778.1 flagellar basal body protein FliL [Afifella sp. IM 167]